MNSHNYSTQTQIGEVCMMLQNESFLSQALQNPAATAQSSPLLSLFLLNNDSFDFVHRICENYYYSSSQPKSSSARSALNQSLIKYIYPVLLVLGVLGNLISFLALLRIYSRRKGHLKFSLSLAALALTDLVVMLIGCLREYLDQVLSLDIRSSSRLACKSILFSCYLFSCYSAYLHAYIAIERWLAVTDPIKMKSRKTSCGVSNKVTLTAIFLGCVMFNLPLVWLPEVQTVIQLDNTSEIGLRTVDECEVSHDLALFLIDSVFYCLIPFLVTILFSLLTLIGIIKSRSTFVLNNNQGSLIRRDDSVIRSDPASSMRASKTSSNLTDSFHSRKSDTRLSLDPKIVLPLLNSTLPTQAHQSQIIGRVRFKKITVPTSNPSSIENDSNSYIEPINSNSNANNNNNNNNATPSPLTSNRHSYGLGRQNSGKHQAGGGVKPVSSPKSNLKITVLLMALPLTYLITSFPIFLIIIHSLVQSNDYSNTQSSSYYYAAKVVMYISNSINILFYVLFGKNMRRDFLAILMLPVSPMTKSCRDNKKESSRFNRILTKTGSNRDSCSTSLRQSGSMSKKTTLVAYPPPLPPTRRSLGFIERSECSRFN